MKLSVRVRGEWFAVPCSDGKSTIQWLGEEALKRYLKLKQASGLVKGWQEEIYEIRKTKGGAILDQDDKICNVLDDNDFVSVVLKTDRANPEIRPQEISYVPEQIPGKFGTLNEVLLVNGYNLVPDDLLCLGKGFHKIKLTKEAEDRVIRSRQLVDTVLKENKVAYGVNTGFGKFASKIISDENLVELQENLVRSHAAGVGHPLTPERTRMLLALRINVLAKGYSGISLETLEQLVEAFNASCLSWVPEKGTVGASGDLAPLAHLALGLIGEGKMWSPESGWGEAKYVLESHNLKPIALKPKEGIALLNGTQLITSIGAEAVERAIIVARQADVVAALSLEVLKGTTRAFDREIQKIRPHRGQIIVARRLRALLHSNTHPSEIAGCEMKGSDEFVSVGRFSGAKINVAVCDKHPMKLEKRGEIISGGNFHGEYPAKALDYLAIAVHELASMSERRLERLVNPALSELPSFLVKDGGLNSGFMIAHCTAAALVSENKVLCHPASVDSLSTSAGTEDHVSMGGFAARKALQVVENVERVIAIELLAACQAIEFLRPLKTTKPLEAIYHLVRSLVKPWDKDRFMAPDIDAITDLLRQSKVWDEIKCFIEQYHMETTTDSRPSSPTTSCSTSHKKRRIDPNNNF